MTEEEEERPSDRLWNSESLAYLWRVWLSLVEPFLTKQKLVLHYFVEDTRTLIRASEMLNSYTLKGTTLTLKPDVRLLEYYPDHDWLQSRKFFPSWFTFHFDIVLSELDIRGAGSVERMADYVRTTVIPAVEELDKVAPGDTFSRTSMYKRVLGLYPNYNAFIGSEFTLETIPNNIPKKLTFLERLLPRSGRQHLAVFKGKIEDKEVFIKLVKKYDWRDMNLASYFNSTTNELYVLRCFGVVKLGFKSDSVGFLVFDFIHGHTLDDYTPNDWRGFRKKLDVEKAVFTAFHSLYSLHRFGYYCFDIHAGNFMVESETSIVRAIDTDGLIRITEGPMADSTYREVIDSNIRNMNRILKESELIYEDVPMSVLSKYFVLWGTDELKFDRVITEEDKQPIPYPGGKWLPSPFQELDDEIKRLRTTTEEV